MPSYVGGKCSRCGKNLKNTTLKYTAKGKLFCFDCYQIVASQIEEEQSKQDEVFDYIKQLFKVYSVSEALVEGIRRLIKEGMTEEDILYVLRYVYEIECADLDLNFLIANVRRYQEEALKYREEQEKIAKINMNKTISNETRTIKIKKETLDEKAKPKFSYNMEDL